MRCHPRWVVCCPGGRGLAAPLPLLRSPRSWKGAPVPPSGAAWILGSLQGKSASSPGAGGSHRPGGAGGRPGEAGACSWRCRLQTRGRSCLGSELGVSAPLGDVLPVAQTRRPVGSGPPCPSGAAPRGPGVIGSRGRCRRSPPGPGCNRRAPGPPPSACWCVREPRGALLRGQAPLTASAGYRSAGCQKAWPQPPLPSTSHPSCTPRSGRGGSCSWALPRAPLYPQKHLAPLRSHPKTHGVLLAVGSAPQKWPREGRGAAKSWRCPPGGRELGAGEGSGVWCVQEAVGLVLRGSQARGPPGSVLGACGVCFFTKREPPRESLHSAARDGVGSSGGASGQSCHLLQQENGTLCPLGCFTCVPAAPRADFLGLCHQKEPELALEPVPEPVPEPCVRAEHPSRCRAPRQGSPRAPEQEICL